MVILYCDFFRAYMFRTKLANTQLIREKKLNDQQARYAAVIAEMEKEKHCWITLENMDSKITEELFAKPSTTGLISRYSEHWRYHLVTTSLGRLLQAKKNDDPDQVRSPLTERLSLMAQASLTKRMVVEEVLDDMIGTGEERAKYKEIVEMYTKTLDDLGNFKNMEEYHLFVSITCHSLIIYYEIINCICIIERMNKQKSHM